MLPLTEKVLVRLPKDLAAALDHYVEKRGQEIPGIRLTRLDVIRACLHHSLQAELKEMATINAQSVLVPPTQTTELRAAEASR